MQLKTILAAAAVPTLVQQVAAIPMPWQLGCNKIHRRGNDSPCSWRDKNNPFTNGVVDLLGKNYQNPGFRKM